MGTLYIVATPIGNLDDLTPRALNTLKQVKLILAEDTRVTSKLLQKKEIETPMRSFHQHSSDAVISKVIEQLGSGDDIALVSDAGTPGVNDPGGVLVEGVLKAFPRAHIVPIPGPNAAMTALSVSGFPADRFAYLGFVPNKKGRQTFFKEVTERRETQVFYESKHRIIKALEQMSETFATAEQSERPLMVARELTKKFETIYRGTSSKVLEHILRDEVLGEFVVIVAPWKR